MHPILVSKQSKHNILYLESKLTEKLAKKTAKTSGSSSKLENSQPIRKPNLIMVLGCVAMYDVIIFATERIYRYHNQLHRKRCSEVNCMDSIWQNKTKDIHNHTVKCNEIKWRREQKYNLQNRKTYNGESKKKTHAQIWTEWMNERKKNIGKQNYIYSHK